MPIKIQFRELLPDQFTGIQVFMILPRRHFKNHVGREKILYPGIAV
jgi:hypothetical protein